jgi:hypothetical protein
VTVTAPPPKSFKLAAGNVSVAAGNSAASMVTITPQNGYTGTIAWTVSSSPSFSNGCFSLPNATVSGTSAVVAMLAVNTTSSVCPAPAIIGPAGSMHSSLGPSPNAYSKDPRPLSALRVTQGGMAMAGLLFLWLLGKRLRMLEAFAGICLLAAIGFAASGCAGTGSSAPPPSSSTPMAAKGTYTVTVVGTDTASASITASTTMTLTVD